jgi:hypothetical protein
MRNLLFLISAILLTGCSANYHLKRAIAKGANVYIERRDTTIITKERTLRDTLILNTVDSVVVTKDKVIVKLVRNHDTIRLSAICKSDTIKVPYYIKTTVTKIEKKDKFSILLQLFFVIFILYVVALLFNRM